jgi:NADH-quinone oxidoreductase subunit G
VVKPLAETRPAWKVLRVLANLLDIPGVSFETSQEVLAHATAKPLHASNLTAAKIDLSASTAAPAVASIYQLDSMVRRAPSLQLTADARQGVTA